MFQTNAFSMKSLHVATMINLCGGCSEYWEYSEYCEYFPLKCSNDIFVKIFAGCNNDQPLWRLLRPQRRAREHPGTLITWFCLRWFCFDYFANHTWTELIEKVSHSNWPQSNCQSNVFLTWHQFWLLSPSGDLGISLVWHNLSPDRTTHILVRLLKSSSNWTKLSMRGP